MKKAIALAIIAFTAGILIGYYNTEEKIVYQTRVEYRNDPNAISKSTLDTEVANARTTSYRSGYAEGRKIGINEGYSSGYAEGRTVGSDEGFSSGYSSGYTVGTEYGKSLILDQIDLRVQEAERTNRNVPLFRVVRN